MSRKAETSYPLALLLSRQWQNHGRWRYPAWEVTSILPVTDADDISGLNCRQVHASENGDHFMWSGLWLELYRDDLQAYYQNMMGATPSLFILCHEQEPEPDLAPITITASHADAEAHMESDGIVLTTDLVSPFSAWLAEFILQHQNLFEHQLAQAHLDKKGKRRHVR